MLILLRVNTCAIDKKLIVCYYVSVMKNIKTIIQDKYYRYQPGEFLPVRSGGELLNKREFHKYRIKWIIKNHSAFFHQLTHQRG